MKKNIIQILKSGNQELFYSSFIAWLLDPDGEHGLYNQFSTWFFEKIGEAPLNFQVDTEKPIKGGRADIEISLDDNRRIVVENKTKSIGSNEQIKNYEGDKTMVVPLGFVAENFPEQQRSSVITYSDILSFLQSANRNSQSLSILVDHFISYLDSALSPFDIFNQFCNELISLDEAKLELSKRLAIKENDNDRRFFQAIYLERLRTYLTCNCPNLILGETSYFNQKKQNENEKPHATKWIIEKNVQGPAFMEAIIYSLEIPQKLKIADKWKAAFNESREPDMSPRIELWISSDNIFSKEDVGVFLIGCWDDNLKNAFLKSNNFKKRGPRNFHHRILGIEDLKYKTMTNIIAEEMGQIWDFEN